jgi:3-oxoacyl-[acyl-carrier protein] reductase
VIDLSNKTALVTGGSRGIGRDIAIKLAQAGCNVAVSGRDLETLKSTTDEIEKLGRKALAIKCDVAKEAEVAEMFKKFLEVFQVIDILVNNAGITKDSLIVRMKEADWDDVIDTNLKSAFLCCKEAAKPMMKVRCGKIINITSVVGLIGNAGQANYTASKAGMIGLTKTLAKEFASRSINVNAVAPGYIATAMTEKLPETEKLIASIPMARFGASSDIANAVLFLASPLSDYITGQVLTVDGGLVM